MAVVIIFCLFTYPKCKVAAIIKNRVCYFTDTWAVVDQSDFGECEMRLVTVGLVHHWCIGAGSRDNRYKIR